MPVLNWLAQNYGAILICAIIIGIFALLIVSLIRDKKAGRSSCCGGCAGCAMSGQCHAARVQKENNGGDSAGASDTAPAPKGGD